MECRTGQMDGCQDKVLFGRLMGEGYNAGDLKWERCACKRPKVTKLAAAEYEHRVNLCFNLFDTFITSKGTKRVGRSCLSLVHKSQTVLSCELAAKPVLCWITAGVGCFTRL